MTKVYMFFNQQYLRYDRGNDRADEGYPLSIGDHWPGFSAAGFDTGVDAGIDWGNGKAYFFKGSQYLRYDIAADRVADGYPKLIAEGWPGLATAGFDRDLSAPVVWGNGSAYLFKNGQYLRYDMALDRSAEGYPLRIADHWPGFAAAGFDQGIDAAVRPEYNDAVVQGLRMSHLIPGVVALIAGVIAYVALGRRDPVRSVFDYSDERGAQEPTGT